MKVLINKDKDVTMMTDNWIFTN